MEKARRLLDEGGLWEMTNLEKFLGELPIEEVWMHIFANGCDICPAKNYCDSQPSGTCCRENFFCWASLANDGGAEDGV